MKRILILDIDSCAECPCIHQYEGGAWCVAKDTPMPINWMIFDEIPEDACPLRPLPQKLPQPKPSPYEFEISVTGEGNVVGKIAYYVNNEQIKGWNACIDAITGETE